jgi:hypothetical protein
MSAVGDSFEICHGTPTWVYLGEIGSEVSVISATSALHKVLDKWWANPDCTKAHSLNSWNSIAGTVSFAATVG